MTEYLTKVIARHSTSTELTELVMKIAENEYVRALSDKQISTQGDLDQTLSLFANDIRVICILKFVCLTN